MMINPFIASFEKIMSITISTVGTTLNRINYRDAITGEKRRNIFGMMCPVSW